MQPSDSDEKQPPTYESFARQAEQYAREEPWRALGIAFFAGLILTLFPVGRILGTLVRLVFALVRPLLLILGVVKVYEEIDRQQR